MSCVVEHRRGRRGVYYKQAHLEAGSNPERKAWTNQACSMWGRAHQQLPSSKAYWVVSWETRNRNLTWRRAKLSSLDSQQVA